MSAAAVLGRLALLVLREGDDVLLILFELALCVGTGLLVVVDVALDEDLCVPVAAILLLQHLQIEPDLTGCLFALLEAADALEHLTFAVISADENHRENDREAQQPQLETPIKVCILEDFGEEEDGVGPEAEGPQATVHPLDALVIVAFQVVVAFESERSEDDCNGYEEPLLFLAKEKAVRIYSNGLLH